MTALEDLYRRYAPDVYRFALWLSGDHAEAQDITSETFVRAWAGRGPAHEHRESLPGRDRAQPRLRRSRRRADLDPDLPDPAPGPEREVERRDELRAVLMRMQRIPEADRAALLMRAAPCAPAADGVPPPGPGTRGAAAPPGGAAPTRGRSPRWPARPRRGA